MKHNMSKNMPKKMGFTLIELLIVIAILGILASIAYPSYQSHILKSRRGDAKAELIKAQLKQSSLHILNPSYSTDKAALGLANNDYYTFTIVSADTTSYLMKAQAIGGQLNDTGCTTLTIDQNSSHTNNDCW